MFGFKGELAGGTTMVYARRRAGGTHRIREGVVIRQGMTVRYRDSELRRRNKDPRFVVEEFLDGGFLKFKGVDGRFSPDMFEPA